MTDAHPLQFHEPDGDRSVVIEDDGRVCYAYLLQNERLVGDVWLYNVSAAPLTVDWRRREDAPFCNPAKYCADATLPRLRPDSDVSCAWLARGAEIWVSGTLWARLEAGARPGWSRGARIAGPLAKPLIDA